MSQSGSRSTRPFVGIQWDCCSTYTRVYREPDGKSYLGQCPRCSKRVRLQVEAGGTDCRFFRVR
jgi:hypothetical protein